MRVRDASELRRWRLRRNLSQRDLAYLCKCSQAAISLLERGGMTSLSDELALCISARLQVPWESLFVGDVDPDDADAPLADAAAQRAREPTSGATSPGTAPVTPDGPAGPGAATAVTPGR